MPVHLHRQDFGDKRLRTRAPNQYITVIVVVELVPDGGGVGGRVSKVRTEMAVWTVRAREQHTSAQLGQWGHGKDIPPTCAGI